MAPGASPGFHLHAARRGSGIDRVDWLVAVILGTVAVVLVLLLPSLELDRNLQRFGAPTERAEHSLTRERLRQPGPPLLWIRFDDESLAALEGDGAAPSLRAQSAAVTPRRAIAATLDAMRARANRPAMVYLDVAITTPDIDAAADLRLAKALTDWRNDPSAPILGLHAGGSCEPPPELGPPRERPVMGFTEGKFAGLVGLAPGPRRFGARKILWSCPSFDGAWQAEWSCITVLGADGPSDLFALPSPGWLAVMARRDKDGLWIRQALSSADAHCRGGTLDNGHGRTPISRYSFVWRGDETIDALSRIRIGGRPLLTMRSAISVLQTGADLSAADGAIVVIGGGNRIFADELPYPGAAAPGSLMVAMALRDAWNFGMAPPGSSKATAVLVAIGFVLIIVLTKFILPRGRRRALLAAQPWWRGPLFMLMHEQIVVLILFALVFAIPGLLGVRVTAALAIIAVLTELQIMIEAVGKDWRREISDLRPGVPGGG